MYEPIRQLIRENRLRKAIHDMGDLQLSREHSSRLVTLDRRLRILENKKIGNLTEDRLLIIEENGLVEDILIFLDQVEFPQRDIQLKKTSHPGAVAGAGEAKKKSPARWIGLAAAILALLTIGFLLWPDADLPKGPPATESRVVVPGEQPSDRLSAAERLKEAQRLEEAKKKEDLRQQELLKERERRIAEADQSQEDAGAFMTRGEQVDMAVAVYSGQKTTTSPDESLTKSLSSYLGRTMSGSSTSATVLTKDFHSSKERTLLVFGRGGADKRLSARRARYLVLADVRNVDPLGKGELRMCIYDSASGRSLTQTEKVPVGTGRSMQEKYLLYAVGSFVKEKLKL